MDTNNNNDSIKLAEDYEVKLESLNKDLQLQQDQVQTLCCENEKLSEGNQLKENYIVKL